MGKARTLDRTDAMLTFLVIIWGTAFPGVKALLQVLDPYQLTWFRYAPFPLLYGAFLLLRRSEAFRRVSGRDWVLMALLGTVGVIGYHFPLNWGLHDTSDGVQVTAATGAILVATTPLWTLLISTLAGRERWHGATTVGSLVAFAGVAVVVFFGTGHAEFTAARKTLVILLAPLSWALYSIYTRPLIHRYGGLFVTGVTLSLGTFTLLPLAFTYGAAPLRALDAGGWAWLAFLALLSTALGYAMWNQALKLRSASAVSAYVYFNPVVATVVGVLFFGERVTPFFLLGSALVLGGVILVNRARQAAAAIAPDPVPTVAKAPAPTEKP
ncbi:MAG: DMT family transporter [Halobacteriales archaeon]|nr:DMT family transporter [Halobacteriales archaeon]